jgi:hypothetical protein
MILRPLFCRQVSHFKIGVAQQSEILLPLVDGNSCLSFVKEDFEGLQQELANARRSDSSNDLMNVFQWRLSDGYD